MKWTKPKYGDKRTVKKFAWLPVDCENNIIVWFEYYDEEQAWESDYYTDKSKWCWNKRISRRYKNGD